MQKTRDPRPTYIAAAIRAGTLADGDILRDGEGRWREVLDVWTDDDLDVALAHYNEHDHTNRRIIEQHLNGLYTYIVARVLIEVTDSPMIGDLLIALRKCDLVTIQVPGIHTAPFRVFPAAEPTSTGESDTQETQ